MFKSAVPQKYILNTQNGHDVCLTFFFLKVECILFRFQINLVIFTVPETISLRFFAEQSMMAP